LTNVDRSFPIDENLTLTVAENGSFFKCSICNNVLCSATENYTDHVLKYDGAPKEAGPNICSNPKQFVDADIVFRQLYCPFCYTLLSTEIVPKSQLTNLRSKSFTNAK
jgi:N-methylhydantoinase B